MTLIFFISFHFYSILCKFGLFDIFLRLQKLRLELGQFNLHNLKLKSTELQRVLLLNNALKIKFPIQKWTPVEKIVDAKRQGKIS